MHPPPAPPVGFSTADEEAGGVEPFEDAALYDFEYRRRRTDVRFYLRIASERRDVSSKPMLDLACGSGRLLLPLVRAGHAVVGLDRSRPMLQRAAARIRRLTAQRRAKVQLLQADLRALPTLPLRARATGGGFALAICAFHSLQHLVAESDLLRFFREARRSLEPGGWLAFDVLPPDPRWIGRDPERRWGRTLFRHPTTRQRFLYTNNHTYDAHRRALHIRLFYQPVDERGRPSGAERVVRLCHRQLHQDEVVALCRRAGLEVIARFGGFDGRPISAQLGDDDENIYVARRPRR
ncbi:MAG TPA: class I SAM-dependent methyltransferase [Polyangia bacterium]